MLTLIAAASENNALGFKGNLLWHLPLDFKHFKTLTTGHCIIMGRKTWETLPKPLPNRKHIVITRNKAYQAELAQVVHSVEEALSLCNDDPNPFVIGGGEVYHLFLEKAQRIELTRVYHHFSQADAFFPEIDKNQWELVKSTFCPKDEKHAFDFSFETYLKRVTL